MDNRILEKRLLYRESGPVPSVNKCAKSFSEMLFATAPARDKNVESFIRDVKAYEFDMRKVVSSIRVSEEELAELVAEEAQIQSQMAAVQQSIIDLNVELTQQHQTKLVRAECESLATRVNKLPHKGILKRQIEESQRNLQATRDTITDVEAKIAKRLRLLEDFEVILRRLTVELPEEERAGDAPQATEESDEDEGREEEAAMETEELDGEEGAEEGAEEGEVPEMEVGDTDGDDAPQT